MDALPSTAAAGVSAGTPLTSHHALEREPSAAPSAVPPPLTPSQQALPALPVAVQRAHLQPPQAKLMTREEMLSFLQLAV
jgi:hypothetical protein